MFRFKSVHLVLPAFELRADFTVRSGEVVGISGPSGSGKSTLVRWAAGLPVPLIKPATGMVTIGEKILFGNGISLPPQKRKLGVVLQDLGLFSQMSVWENVSFALRLQSKSKKKCRDVAMYYLNKLKLAPLAERSIETLSGGERQRIALLRAWLSAPEGLLLDEPFTALDTSSKEAVIQNLFELLKEKPIPVILISHQVQDFRSCHARALTLQGYPGPQRAIYSDGS